MIQNSKPPLQALARLEHDADFMLVMQWFKTMHSENDKLSRGSNELIGICRAQGAVSVLDEIITKANTARAILEK